MEEQTGAWDGYNRRVPGMAHRVLGEQSQIDETSIANKLKLSLDIFEMRCYTIPCKVRLYLKESEMRYQDG